MIERRKENARKAVEKRGQDYEGLSAGINAIRQRRWRTLVLVLFTVRERKLRKLGAGRTVEAARADAAKQILRYVGEGEKIPLEQSVIRLERGRTSYTGTPRVHPMGRLAEGNREPRDDAARMPCDTVRTGLSFLRRGCFSGQALGARTRQCRVAHPRVPPLSRRDQTMGNIVQGKCAVCGNPLMFRVLTENQEVSADTLRECMKNDDFAELYITESVATSVLEYRCTSVGCRGSLSESDAEILEGFFHPVNAS